MVSNFNYHDDLGSMDFARQSRAARHFAQVGDADHAELLCNKAVTAKSYGVRLACGTAASEIVYRLRLAGPLDEKFCERIERIVRFTDPERSPSLLLVLGAMGRKQDTKWLGRLLRDPRTTVRVAAVSAFRRMVLSHEHWAKAKIEQNVTRWIRDEKMPLDVRSELATLCSEIGWTIPVGLPFVLPEEVLERTRIRSRPDAWVGLWVSNGADVWAPKAEGSHWLAIGNGLIVSQDQAPSAFFLVDAEAVTTHWSVPMRLIWAPKRGEMERVAAIQGAGRTWYRASEDELTRFVCESFDPNQPDWRAIVGDWVDVLVAPEGNPPKWLNKLQSMSA